MRYGFILLVALLAALPVTAADDANPLLQSWDTPFGVPPLDRIETEHFLPAFELAIAEKQRQVEAIAADKAAPNFANTLEALETSGALLARVGGVFYNMMTANISEQLQAVAKEVAPKISALNDDVRMNPVLFERVRAVWREREQLDLGPEQARLLEETYRSFVRGGAELDDQAKESLRAVNTELALIGLQFGDNVLADTNDFQLVVKDAARLGGLPEGVRATAAQAAHEAGLDEGWLFTLHAPSIWPFLSYADDRELRREILEAYTSRGAHDGPRDNRPLAARMAELRVERAKLLGYDTHAHFVLEENMAERPEAVYGLLWRLWNPALAVARSERDALQQMIELEGHDFKLQPWDWRYYAEKVKLARYDLDEDALRPYFALDNVRDGAFWLANRLWGISFVERDDIPVYHSEVRTFEVKDIDGSHLGVLLLDYHPRADKRGGAWMNTYRDQWREGDRDIRPIVVNCGNFSRPTGDVPALLSLDEVETLFHEFGHGLHGLLARGTYSSLSGTAVARDFVELPSQIMENWVLEPEVLKQYARHYETGEVIPDELVAKIDEAGKFNQGFATVEYLAASFLDMDWHTMTESVSVDPMAFERQSMTRIGLPSEIVVRYRTPYFSHIFGPGGGYSAGYYSYIWAEVLDADAFNAFKEKGVLDRATATAFRREILERGGTEDPMVLYTRFRGTEPGVEPLLKRRGLK